MRKIYRRKAKVVIDAQYFIELLRGLGPAGIVYLAIFIAGLVLRKWVLGWTYDEMKARCNEYKQERDDLLDIAIFGVEASDKSTALMLRRTRREP